MEKAMPTKHPVRFVTAASLFDGHDAAIHIMRRILQDQGAEVIHLGHNRSVKDIVKAAIEEDVHGIAISSYQGGHMEYFRYMYDMLKEENRSEIQIFGGGGGVIIDDEIKELERYGIKKIFSPKDGQEMTLTGMIAWMLNAASHELKPAHELSYESPAKIARIISTLELGKSDDKSPYTEARKQILSAMNDKKGTTPALILGITGTGGAGKSTLIDELLLRFLQAFPDKKVAVLSIDPTKQRTGGALLGDRIRYNSASDNRVFVRSLATRRASLSTAKSTEEILSYLALGDVSLVILETSGIGQNDSEVKNLADISLYVMTPEFGARGQLEKIDMLDQADFVAINKSDKPLSEDALRDVQKAYQRNHKRFEEPKSAMPVYATSAHLFGDRGTNRLWNALFAAIKAKDGGRRKWDFTPLPEASEPLEPLIPRHRSRYLAEIKEAVLSHHETIQKQAALSQKIEHLLQTKEALPNLSDAISKEVSALQKNLDPALGEERERFQKNRQEYEQGHVHYSVRQKTIEVNNYSASLSHLPIPTVIAPRFSNAFDEVKYVGLENLPGHFPFTAGVFPFKRQNEDPTRMFAGEGGPERTNRRFHFLCKDHEAKRLSTAFDSVTLYGENPDNRPDIYGKVGNAGVSVCSLDDAKRLYSGFNLISPNVSVSMTINGPAPTLLAFFFNASIDAAVERELKKNGQWPTIEQKIAAFQKEHGLPKVEYRGELPDGHDGMGLGFLGIPSDLVVDKSLYEEVKKTVLQNIRGTIQADILKEDQAQNTCIFSTEFSLAMMADIQQYFIDHQINNFYSVSVSGYHIAEAGANPISELAFTLANGFTLLEYYQSRGMNVDDVARNFSFFFSNGVDPEYAVIGRVARRIWAIALKNVYKANARSQMLKYHIQTSGRSLHAQEMTFNDIRTTLQALYAITDNCNSLHTNAFDEAITTPTEASVRQAVAIQMIINHELGLTKNQNPTQGSYFIEYLTNEVEKAVLEQFDKLDRRGGVLGAMETMYQRSTIQEESLYYEQQKNSGELKIIGVNTFHNNHPEETSHPPLLMRSSTEEKDLQVAQIRSVKDRFVKEKAQSLAELKRRAQRKEHIFDALMEASKYASLGEITHSFFEVGGAYRRSI